MRIAGMQDCEVGVEVRRGRAGSAGLCCHGWLLWAYQSPQSRQAREAHFISFSCRAEDDCVRWWACRGLDGSRQVGRPVKNVIDATVGL